MKKNGFLIGILFLLLFLLLHPAQSLSAARDGLNLWMDTLLPTLLPFLILTGVLLHTNLIAQMLHPFSEMFRVLFGLSVHGTYVMILGLLCGYPMGAKLSADMYAKGRISRREAEYLLTFCGIPSPAFLTGYLAGNCLRGNHPILPMILTLLGSNLFCMLFFRFFIYGGHTTDVLRIRNTAFIFHPQGSQKETSQAAHLGAVMDVSIMNGFETMARLGGYILLFSILSACIDHYWPTGRNEKYVILGMTELTTGLHSLASSGMSGNLLYLTAMTITAFGGLCIMFQTKSVLGRQLSVKPYICAKCINAAVTALLVLIF